MSIQKGTVRVRLKKIHFHNGEKKKPKTVLRVSKFTADWLVGRAVAEIIGE